MVDFETTRKHGRKFESQIFCITGHDVIMPERLSAAKKFGNRSRHRIAALLRLSLRDSWKNIASAWATATVKSRPNDFGEALEVHQQNQADDLTIKWATRHYWNQIFIALLKVGRLVDREIRRVMRTDCKQRAAPISQDCISDAV
jgi:hypothetical protein